MCGGASEDRCYAYNPRANSWRMTGRILSKLTHTGFAVHPILGLVLTGGHDGSARNYVQSSRDGVTFRRDHAPLPAAKWCHCLVSVSDNELMNFGGAGSGSSAQAFSYDVASNRWSNLRPMPAGGWGFGCGLDKTANVVVVASGTPGTRVQILNLATRTWTLGKMEQL